MRTCYVLCYCQKTSQPPKYLRLNDYFAEKLNWSFCVSVCWDGAAHMIGRLSDLNVQIKEIAPECEATHCVIHREMLASRKISPELNNVFDNVLKDFQEFQNCLTTTLLNFENAKCEYIICGDININLLSSSSNKRVATYIKTLMSNVCNSLINNPTRFSFNT